jgi:hypothetical protein
LTIHYSHFKCSCLAFCFEADLFHPKRGGTVKRGHIRDQGATAKLQIGVRAGAQLGAGAGAGAGAQLEAEAAAQEEAEAIAQIMMNILGKQMEKDLLVLKTLYGNRCLECCLSFGLCLLM